MKVLAAQESVPEPDVFQCDLGRLAGLFKGQQHFDKSHSEAVWGGTVLSSREQTTQHNAPLFTCLYWVFLSECGGWCESECKCNSDKLAGIWSFSLRKKKSFIDQINGVNIFTVAGKK